MHRAARTGDVEEIRRLVAAGDRLDSTFNTELDPCAHKQDATPFMVAAGSSDGAGVETLRVLLELGADAQAIIDGRSAATFASQGLVRWHHRGGDAERLRFVLQAGSPLPTVPGEANRLLCNTAATGDAERVRILLQHGLDARGHWDPVVARETQKRTMEHFFESIPEEVRASLAESMQEVEARMFEQQCSAPSKNEIPLFCAVESGSAECVRLLLAAGAAPNARDGSQRTAMYYAGSAEVIRVLMQAGVPLEDADAHGWSPLVDAVSDGESSMARVRALIEAGANVNATHDQGYTVFMSAVGISRYPALLRMLVASGANPHTVTELGYNAFHAAIDVDAEESVRDTLSYLKELGVSIEHRTKGNQTPLARAIQEGTGLEVQVLCELGADANAVCRKHACGGESCTHIDLPLLFHSANGIGVHRDVKTEALLRAGANPLATDADGFTPLMHVVASLCQNAPNYEESYQAFFEGLDGLWLENKSMPNTRHEFIAGATPFLRAYVEQFAGEIPLSASSDYAEEWRKEQVFCIVSLSAYEGWARHEHR